MSKPKTRITSRSRPSKTTSTTIDPTTLPERYILIVDGACLEPDIPHGTPVVIERDSKVAAGDLAVLYFKPDRIPPGNGTSSLKRVVMAPPPHVKFPWREHPKSEVHAVVIVEMTNPVRRFAVKCEHLLGIHKCTGPVPSEATYNAETKSYRLPDTEEKCHA
jgi:hypothetical protein